MIRRILLAGAAVAAAVFAGTGAFDDNTHRDEHGVIDERGGVGVRAMHVGDCIQLPVETLVQSVEGVPCEVPHDAQVYARFDAVGVTELTDHQIEELVARGCIERWQLAIGTDLGLDHLLGFSAFQPPSGQWADGDRAAACLVVAQNGSRLSGSHVRAGTTEAAS